MAASRAAVLVYSTRIPVDGWAGVPLLGIAATLAIGVPEAARLLMAGIAGGIGFGAILAALHRPR